MSYLCLHVGCSSASRCSDFRCFAQDFLLLEGHTVLAGSIAVLLIMEDGVSMVNQQLVLLGWREQLSAG